MQSERTDMFRIIVNIIINTSKTSNISIQVGFKQQEDRILSISAKIKLIILKTKLIYLLLLYM